MELIYAKQNANGKCNYTTTTTTTTTTITTTTTNTYRDTTIYTHSLINTHYTATCNFANIYCIHLGQSFSISLRRLLQNHKLIKYLTIDYHMITSSITFPNQTVLTNLSSYPVLYIFTSKFQLSCQKNK